MDRAGSHNQYAHRSQPPLVDSTACLCRVDAGLKTVAGAKKYVPSTKLCVNPSVRASIHPTRQKPPRSERKSQPFLPGLPDDLAIACLIRVPRTEHRKLRLVCKKWNRLLAGNYYYALRKNIGTVEEWIYIIKKDRDGRVSWDAFDPVNQLWQPLPPVPKEYSVALGFGCAVLSGCQLYLFGGWDQSRGSMRRVIYYNAKTNKWNRAADMLRRRHCFGYCVMNNCLYVAGGESEGVQHPLKSAEKFDPAKNRWSFIADMTTAMSPRISIVYDGKWFLKGLGPHQEALSEVYLPESDNWDFILNPFVAGWRNPSLCLHGKLYSVDCKDGCKLRVYDEESGTWKKHMDSKMHLGGSRALEAASMVPLGEKLCIIRNNLSIDVVDVTRPVSDGNVNQVWETIAGKGQVKTFVTNLWSNISGRNRLRHHIIQCHVLQV